MLARQHRIRIFVSIGLFLYFTVFFLLIAHVVEWNQFHPYQGRAHDSNGIPIGPP